MRIAKFDRYDMVNSPMADKPSFTIWFSGCHFHCDGCQNEQLWDKNFGEEFEVDDLIQIISTQAMKLDIEDVVLLGGEPLDQNIDEIKKMCLELYATGYNIWLYTGYEFDEIPQDIIDCCYTIKTGRYDESLRDESRFPITTNQKVFRYIAGDWKQIFKEGK